MITFPICKINLGLHVVSKREDGYHNIETCFFPVPWKDILEIIRAKETKIFVTGNEIPGDQHSNIVLKAYELLKKDYSIGPIEIHLHKVIPHGAGLGGGSSDGTHALKLLNNIFDLDLSLRKLKEYASKLGSDCPFFVESTPMLASGRGEVLNSVAVDLFGFAIVIVKPAVHVSTAQAYAGISPHAPANSLVETLQKPVFEWKGLLKNDFEESVFAKHPTISKVKDKLYQLGATYASMSGSGSSVYGLFKPGHSHVNESIEFPEMNTWTGQL